MLKLDNIDTDCPKTWALLSEGNTKGCFQLESRLGQSMAKKLKPSNIEELAALISIMRPGCLEAVRDGKTVSQHFIDKKNGQESIDYFHSSLESILESTYGEMVYQEQAMQIAQKIAGFNLQEADELRKSIGKKNTQLMAKVKGKFLSGTKKLGMVTEAEAEQIFSWIEKSQRYSFNKSHAISYAINGYLSAYYKAHNPLVFFTSYLRFSKDKIDPQEEVKELINNAIEMGINVSGPCISKLNKEFELFEDTIVLGFTNIKAVGESVYNKLINLITEHKFNYKTDNVWKLLIFILSNININAAKAIVTSGALNIYKKSRKELCFCLDILSNLTKKEKEYLYSLDINKFNNFLSILEYTYLNLKLTKNRKEIFHNHINNFKNPPYSLTDNLQWIAENETYLFGVSITCNKSDAYYSEINTISCQEYKHQEAKKKLSIIAEIQRISVIKTKKGQNAGMEMAFIELGDSTGTIKSAVLFPEQYQKYKNFLTDEAVLVFSGTKSSKSDNSFIIERCVMPSS
jgi:DNA polymerase-3 subunit alpha